MNGEPGPGNSEEPLDGPVHVSESLKEVVSDLTGTETAPSLEAQLIAAYTDYQRLEGRWRYTSAHPESLNVGDKGLIGRVNAARERVTQASEDLRAEGKDPRQILLSHQAEVSSSHNQES